MQRIARIRTGKRNRPRGNAFWPRFGQRRRARKQSPRLPDRNGALAGLVVRRVVYDLVKASGVGVDMRRRSIGHRHARRVLAEPDHDVTFVDVLWHEEVERAIAGVPAHLAGRHPRLGPAGRGQLDGPERCFKPGQQGTRVGCQAVPAVGRRSRLRLLSCAGDGPGLACRGLDRVGGRRRLRLLNPAGDGPRLACRGCDRPRLPFLTPGRPKRLMMRTIAGVTNAMEVVVLPVGFVPLARLGRRANQYSKHRRTNERVETPKVWRLRSNGSGHTAYAGSLECTHVAPRRITKMPRGTFSV